MDSSLRNQLPKSLPISIISTIRRLSFINERSETMLDNTDYQILNELTQNSRMTMKELGQKVHLTGQATATRVAKLEDSGVIEGYTIKVNDTKLGYNIHVIINTINVQFSRKFFHQMQVHLSYAIFKSSKMVVSFTPFCAF